MKRPRDPRRQVADERAFTLTEMIVVLAILGIVLSALLAVFVSALRTEVDQNKHFVAQQNARLALGKLRREIHCARYAEVPVANAGAKVTLTSASTATTGYCHASQATWCAVPAGAGFSLYRYTGTDCAGPGLLVAEHLTSGQVFGCAWAGYSRATVHVDIRVDPDPVDARHAYRLFDDIVLRGSARNAQADELACPAPAPA